MVSWTSVPLERRDGAVVPRYLSAADHAWLRELVDAFEACVGAPRALLEARLRGDARGGRARRVALAALDRLYPTAVDAPIEPRRARAVVFRAAAAADDPELGLQQAAAELGLGTAALRAALLADTPRHRRLRAPTRALSLSELALEANLLMAQALLRRATELRVELDGNARAVVRDAKLRGLLCHVESAGAAAARGAVLHLSGPLSLHQPTARYGRAFAALLPLLGWSRRYRAIARCALGAGERSDFELRSGDPIPPGREPRRYDSRVEARFARDFLRTAPEWELVREPAPLRAGAALVFPDFGLRHRHDPQQRWLLEIVGYWTPGYLAQKLARLRAAAAPNLILCVDAELGAGAGPPPADARVLYYRRRVDAAAVLRLLEGGGASPAWP